MFHKKTQYYRLLNLTFYIELISNNKMSFLHCSLNKSKFQGSLIAVHWLLFKTSQRTIASPSISCVSCFTCACVRSHSIATDRVDVTAMIVVRTLVGIWKHRITRNIRNRCYFMVREWVRFLFTSCEESQTKERDKGEWVSDSSKPESIKIVQGNQPWSNSFIVFVLIDIYKKSFTFTLSIARQNQYKHNDCGARYNYN